MIQRIRRHCCATVTEDPGLPEEPATKKANFLSQNFKIPISEERIPPATLHLERFGQKRVPDVIRHEIHCDREQDIPDCKRRSIAVHPDIALEIQEYDLSVEEKIRNIEATETAKRAAMKRSMASSTNAT